MRLAFLFRIKKIIQPWVRWSLWGRTLAYHPSPFGPALSSSMNAGCQERWYWPTLFPPQGFPCYLHLPHLRLFQQQLPCLLRAQRCPHSSHPRLWMAWAEGPCSAPSRISKKELWGKPKPVIIVLLRSAKASCLHWEGKVLLVFFPPPAPQVPFSWMNTGWASAATYCLADAHVRGFSRGK